MWCAAARTHDARRRTLGAPPSKLQSKCTTRPAQSHDRVKVTSNAASNSRSCRVTLRGSVRSTWVLCPTASGARGAACLDRSHSRSVHMVDTTDDAGSWRITASLGLAGFMAVMQNP